MANHDGRSPNKYPRPQKQELPTKTVPWSWPERERGGCQNLLLHGKGEGR